MQVLALAAENHGEVVDVGLHRTAQANHRHLETLDAVVVGVKLAVGVVGRGVQVLLEADGENLGPELGPIPV